VDCRNRIDNSIPEGLDESQAPTMTADLLENQAAIGQVPHVSTHLTLDRECMTSRAILRPFPQQVDNVSYWRLIGIHDSRDLFDFYILES